MPHTFEDTNVNTDYFTTNLASGGAGGNAFNYISTSGATLKEINVWKKEWRIIAFEAKMTDGSAHFVGLNDGGTKATFTFKDGERIAKVNLYASKKDGSSTGWRRLGAIGILTSFGRSWHCYASDLPDKSYIFYPEVGSGICCGIFGSSGTDVDRLGFAMLREVKRMVLTNVTYPNLDTQLVASQPQVIAHQVFNNQSKVMQDFKLEGSRDVTITREWTISASLSFTETIEVTAGIPDVASVDEKSSWTVSVAGSYTTSTTTFSVHCDVFTITDGVTQKETSICSSLLENEWMSSGNIAVLKFNAGVGGHGFSYVYDAYPQNKTISACDRHYTSAVGEIYSISYPEGVIPSSETCTVYITGTPEKSIQIVFDSFKMTDDTGKHSCIKVQDLLGGEEDEFCGQLSPFIWESRGSRVRLVYNPMHNSEGFKATYSNKDV